MVNKNFLIVVSDDGKVKGLHWSKNLVELNTVKMLYQGGEVEVMCAVGEGSEVENVGTVSAKSAFRRNGKPFANRVRCKETGEVYWSAQDCHKKTGIPIASIYKSIRCGHKAMDKHFEYYGEPEETNTKDF